jgi:hypothetical protein
MVVASLYCDVRFNSCEAPRGDPHFPVKHGVAKGVSIEEALLRQG